MGQGPTGIGNDIYSIAFVFMVMLLGKPLAFAGKGIQHDQVWDLIPNVYSDALKQVAVDLSVHVVGTQFKVEDQQIVNWTRLDTLERARNLITLANQVLEKSPVPDLGWTKPAFLC